MPVSDPVCKSQDFCASQSVWVESFMGLLKSIKHCDVVAISAVQHENHCVSIWVGLVVFVLPSSLISVQDPFK